MTDHAVNVYQDSRMPDIALGTVSLLAEEVVLFNTFSPFMVYHVLPSVIYQLGVLTALFVLDVV